MGIEDSRIFSSTSSGEGLFQSFHQGVWFLFIELFFFLLLLLRLSSFPEVFLGPLFVPDDCLALRMHPCSPPLHLCLPLASASAVHSSSKSNSSVYRLNSWLHSSSVWASGKKKKFFGGIHFSCLVRFVCVAFTWPWNATRKPSGEPRVEI